ncbi:D-cysteine desulfhydrase family protein [Ruegeria sp. SCP11]|uniref:D-cysteine desulfhydrase family protein n=1 Tax=Ruegeria sp. SCP11 TaxID=3141378 RepID=UPI003337C1AA
MTTEQMNIDRKLSEFPRARLMTEVTQVERLDRLSDRLGIDLWLKRDDLTGLSFGGNKTRQLEFYFGEAVQQRADTVLITGAVQSNFVRTAAAAAARLGMKSVLQLEERVPGMGEQYYRSGNVLLAKVLGAEHMHFPVGEDEVGADNALHERAAQLIANGHRPYVIHLGIDHPPLGALGYVQGGAELGAQISDFDAAVVPSGSGSTHGGFLTGLRLSGVHAPVYGICVRRDQDQQYARMEKVLGRLAALMDFDPAIVMNGINVWDGVLAPGYGQVGQGTRDALTLMARTEGIFLDPVYSAKTFSGLLGLLDEGVISKGQKVVMLHTGGLPALFGYQEVIESI